jgi:hypothetical protein
MMASGVGKPQIGNPPREFSRGGAALGTWFKFTCLTREVAINAQNSMLIGAQKDGKKC